MKNILKNAKKFVDKKKYSAVKDLLIFSDSNLITSNITSTYRCKDSRFKNIFGSVSFSQFEKIAKKLKFDFQIIQKDNDLCIVSEKGTFKLPLSSLSDLQLDIQSYDLPLAMQPDIVCEKVCSFDSDTIENINKAFKFVGTDDLRPVLQRVHLITEGLICATNCHYMFYPKHTLSLENNLSLVNEIFFKKCDVYKNVNFLVLVSGNESVFEKVDDYQRAPSFQSVIPQKNSLRYRIDKSLLVERLELALLSVDKITNAVYFDFNFDNTCLSVKAECKYNCDLPESNFILKYCVRANLLLDLIKEIDNDVIELNFHSDNAYPVSINDTALLMPVSE